MSADNENSGAPEIKPPDLRLRPERPRVTRLSRRVLIILGSVSAIAIAGALFYALQTRKGSDGSKELYATGNRQTADGLAGLPRDYTGIPRQAPPLGPPLPGDLGRPILNAEAKDLAPQGLNSEEQREQQENEAARVSHLFTQTSLPTSNPVQAINAAAAAATGSPSPNQTPGVDSGSAQNMQDRKLAFINGPSDKRTVSNDRLALPASPYVVQAGSIIPAALITGIRSDLPGEITAQVTEAVYDSPSGHYLLIPQGARLIGQYDSSIAFGQSRVLLVWNRIIMPNGTSIVLERLPGSDTQGYAGLEDDVDYHWWELAKAAALSTLLGVGAEAGTSANENNLVQAIRSGASNSISQTGQQIVQRQLNVQPTLTIRSGFPIRIIVNRDLVLEPYKV
jgi:type IV secretion system protein VirB10